MMKKIVESLKDIRFILSFFCISFGTGMYSLDNISVKLVEDTYRAIAPISVGDSLTDTTKFEARYAITNQILCSRTINGTLRYEVLLNDVSDDNAHTAMITNEYSKLSNGLYEKDSDTVTSYTVTPIGLYQNLLKSIYNPVYSQFGTMKTNDNKFWHDTAVSITSVVDCYKPANQLANSGAKASGVSCLR